MLFKKLLTNTPPLAAGTKRWGIQRGEAQLSPLVARANLVRAERNHTGKIPRRLRRGFLSRMMLHFGINKTTA